MRWLMVCLVLVTGCWTAEESEGTNSGCDAGAGGSAGSCSQDPKLCDPTATCPAGQEPVVCEAPADLRPDCTLTAPCSITTTARLFCCPPP